MKIEVILLMLHNHLFLAHHIEKYNTATHQYLLLVHKMHKTIVFWNYIRNIFLSTICIRLLYSLQITFNCKISQYLQGLNINIQLFSIFPISRRKSLKQDKCRLVIVVKVVKIKYCVKL